MREFVPLARRPVDSVQMSTDTNRVVHGQAYRSARLFQPHRAGRRLAAHLLRPSNAMCVLIESHSSLPSLRLRSLCLRMLLVSAVLATAAGCSRTTGAIATPPLQVE